MRDGRKEARSGSFGNRNRTNCNLRMLIHTCGTIAQDLRLARAVSASHHQILRYLRFLGVNSQEASDFARLRLVHLEGLEPSTFGFRDRLLYH